MPLTQAQVLELYAKRRTKGTYLAILTHAREDSDENGFAAKATYPQLSEKNSATIYQGFRNAAEKMGIEDNVDIINADDDVFVLFTDRVELVASEDSE